MNSIQVDFSRTGDRPFFDATVPRNQVYTHDEAGIVEAGATLDRCELHRDEQEDGSVVLWLGGADKCGLTVMLSPVSAQTLGLALIQAATLRARFPDSDPV
jgi:hypothetical protein